MAVCGKLFFWALPKKVGLSLLNLLQKKQKDFKHAVQSLTQTQ